MRTRRGIASLLAWVVVFSLFGSAVASAALPPGGTFNDDNGNIFEGAIEAIAAAGITEGCNPPANDHYCPSQDVTRGEMAVFLVRAMGYTDNGGGNLFTDDNGLFYENAADRLRTAGVTLGCNPPANTHYCGERKVTRAEMAAFLVRAKGYTDNGGGDLFTDDDGSIYENAIDKLGAAGVTKGCNPPANTHFCPNDYVTRGEMAAFLARALGLSPIYPPAPATADDLLVIGDWGSGDGNEQAIAALMHQAVLDHPVAAILTTGDNIYSNSTGSTMAPFSWMSGVGLDWWITWGNHDEEDAGRIAVVNGVFGDPPMWTKIQWGEVDVIILDSNQVTTKAQLDFLKSQLAASSRPTILAFHHPVYSCANHGDTADVIDNWLPLFDKDVVLVLNGHDHNYQRFADGGVTYVVTGGGGRGLYSLESCPNGHPTRIAGESTHHFLDIQQTKTALVVKAIDDNGSVIDTFNVALP
ncbi:MAG: metallophosphoesterase [Acidimicrobiia bacterium]